MRGLKARSEAGFTPSEPALPKSRPACRQAGYRPPRHSTLSSWSKRGDLPPTGFTLIELLVAMTFFSFMMLLVSVGVIQVMRLYQADIATKRTQNAARVAMEDITREVRDASTIGQAVDRVLCLEGAKTVRYDLVDIVSDGRLSLRKTTGGSCIAPEPPDDDNSLIIIDATKKNIQAREFLNTPTYIDSNGNGAVDAGETTSVRISLIVTTGNPDLFEVDGKICNPGPGSQFCSTTNYTNVVSLRGTE